VCPHRNEAKDLNLLLFKKQTLFEKASCPRLADENRRGLF
jgi:hypothetical protein